MTDNTDERPYIVAFNAGFEAYSAHSFKPLWTPPPANPHVPGTREHAGWAAGWEEACDQHEYEMRGDDWHYYGDDFNDDESAASPKA